MTDVTVRLPDALAARATATLKQAMAFCDTAAALSREYRDLAEEVKAALGNDRPDPDGDMDAPALTDYRRVTDVLWHAVYLLTAGGIESAYLSDEEAADLLARFGWEAPRP